MSDREIMAKFNSLLFAGLTLEQAKRIADPMGLSESFAQHHRYLLAVCQAAGGSPVSALRNLEQIAEQQHQNQWRLRVASTVPRSTARLMLGLPLGAALLGQLLGLGSIAIFFNSTPALASLLCGLMLLLAAQAWSQRILALANRVEQGDQIVLDAIALCLDTGLPLGQARGIAQTIFQEVFKKQVAEQIQIEISEFAAFSELSGAPVAKLFRNRAEQNRRARANEQNEGIERVSIRLLTPLALLVLPAFVLIAVLPITISLITN